jgi:AraC family transcriptional regulator
LRFAALFRLCFVVGEFDLPGVPPPHPLVLPYEITSSKSIEGDWFRIEVQAQDVTGHRDFDVQFPEHHLFLVPDGGTTRVVARIDGKQFEPFRVAPGHLTVLPRGERIRGYLDGVGLRSELRLGFRADFLARMSDAEIDVSRLHLLLSTDLRNPAVLQPMAALRRELERPGLMGRLYTDSLVIVALTELLRDTTVTMPTSSSEALSPRRLRRTVEYIDVHIGEDLALKTLADVLAIPPARFAREFRHAMGLPVHRYLLSRRVEWAAALLAGTKDSIADIALTIGFSSQAHLTTAFRRIYRTTPAAYRRQRG